jgi:hypothetical protein
MMGFFLFLICFWLLVAVGRTVGWTVAALLLLGWLIFSG